MFSRLGGSHFSRLCFGGRFLGRRLHCRRFYLGQPAMGKDDLVEQVDVPSRLLRKILDELVRLGFITETVQGFEGTGYQPARALEKIRLHDVIRSLAADGDDYSHLRNTPERVAVAEVAGILSDAEMQALEGMTLRDLVLRVEEADDRGEDQFDEAAQAVVA